MKANNPFTLTFGKRPAEYISRHENMEMVLSTFSARQPVSQAYLIEGIRGSGKTVLMTAISKELESRDNWIVADLNSTRNLLDDLAERLTDACRKKTDFLENGFSISAAGFGVGLNGRKRDEDSVSVIEELFAELKKKNKNVLITIDEVQHDRNMRNFASQFQIFIRKDYPVFLLMTGLYEQIYSIQNDPALTFLLRTPKIHLEPLSIAQITKQYANIFQIDVEKAGMLARITKGYAFAFQALGMLYYEYSDSLSMSDILSKLDDLLDDFVYRKIWESLSGNEQAIVKCMPETKIKTGEVCSKLHMTSSVFSKYRDRLMKKGLFLSPGYGYVELALPRFSRITALYS